MDKGRNVFRPGFGSPGPLHEYDLARQPISLYFRYILLLYRFFAVLTFQFLLLYWLLEPLQSVGSTFFFGIYPTAPIS